jgi:hypothetical protein
VYAVSSKYNLQSLIGPMLFSIQVNIPAESGDMGVLANHVPSVEQLRPGIVDIIEDGSSSSKQFFGMPPARIFDQAYNL